MIDNKEINIRQEEEIEDIKKETPLSVRVDNYYKDLFLELSEKPGFSRKRLLESMISSYIRKEKDEDRQSNLNLEHEISLISNSLEDILKSFKTISIKAQDTIGSARGFYQQQLENMKKNNEALELKIQGVEEERKRAVLEKKEAQLTNEELIRENKSFTEKISSMSAELAKVRDSHSAVLNEIYNLRRIEGENIRLMTENKELLIQIEKNKDLIAQKEKENQKLLNNYQITETKRDREVELLKGTVELLEEKIKKITNEKENDIKEFERIIRREAELNKESEILQLKQEYNNLQIQYIRDVGALKK
jgi:hypothetical protein